MNEGVGIRQFKLRVQLSDDGQIKSSIPRD